MEIRYSPKALDQQAAFIDYFYDEVSVQVGMDFEDAIERALASLQIIWKYEIKYDNVRTYLIKPFHIQLHYRVNADETVLTVDGVFDDRSLGHV